MEQKLIHTLERDVQNAIAEVMAELRDRLPCVAEDHTLHAMAKAAVTVYEAVADSQRPPKRR